MKVRTDFHSVNLATGEKTRSIVGDGQVIHETQRTETPEQAGGERDMYSIICGACQILDVVKQEWAESWSEWDQSIRDGLSSILMRLKPVALQKGERMPEGSLVGCKIIGPHTHEIEGPGKKENTNG